MTYQPILQVRDSDGNLIDILTIRGKSAWDLAKESGYSGTAQNLSEALSLISGGFYWEWQNGTNLGPSAVLHFGENSYNIGAIPMATQIQSGIITTTSQSFKGTKTFLDSITFQSDVTLNKSNVHIIGTVQNDGKAFRISSAKIHTGSGKNYSIGLHMGSGQTNRGLYDFTSDKWIIYSDIDNNVRVQGAAKSVSWHKGRDGALICMNCADDLYRPALSIRTYEWEATEKDANGTNVTVLYGGDWAFGNYRDEDLKLTFTSTSNYNANKNATKQFTFFSNGSLGVPGGLSVSGKTVCAGSLQVYGGSDTADDASTFSGHLQIGKTDNCIMIDDNEVAARKSGALGPIYFKSTSLNNTGYIFARGGYDDGNRPVVLSVPHSTGSKANCVDNIYCTSKNLCIRRGYPGGTYKEYAVAVEEKTSDIRLKDNIQDTQIDALSILNQFEMKSFDRIDTKKHWKIGFIADQIEKLDNSFVKEPDIEAEIPVEEQMKTINTFYLTGYLIKGIQELSLKNQQLENTIVDLKTQLELIKLAIGG